MQMVTTKQLNIKNRTYYFYNDLINLKNFDPKLLKLDKKSSMDMIRHYTSEYSINSVNPLHLLITELDGYIGE